MWMTKARARERQRERDLKGTSSSSIQIARISEKEMGHRGVYNASSEREEKETLNTLNGAIESNRSSSSSSFVKDRNNSRWKTYSKQGLRWAKKRRVDHRRLRFDHFSSKTTRVSSFSLFAFSASSASMEAQWIHCRSYSFLLHRLSWPLSVSDDTSRDNAGLRDSIRLRQSHWSFSFSLSYSIGKIYIRPDSKQKRAGVDAC